MKVMHFRNHQERMKFLRGEFKILEPKEAFIEIKPLEAKEPPKGTDTHKTEKEGSKDAQRSVEASSEEKPKKKAKKKAKKETSDEVSAE